MRAGCARGIVATEEGTCPVKYCASTGSSVLFSVYEELILVHKPGIKLDLWPLPGCPCDLSSLLKEGNGKLNTTPSPVLSCDEEVRNYLTWSSRMNCGLYNPG